MGTSEFQLLHPTSHFQTLLDHTNIFLFIWTEITNHSLISKYPELISILLKPPWQYIRYDLSGSGYLYTTHGWTVVSAVVEAAAGKPFTKVMRKLFYDLGLDSTYLDKNGPIVYNRARWDPLIYAWVWIVASDLCLGVVVASDVAWVWIRQKELGKAVWICSKECGYWGKHAIWSN